MQIEEEVKKNAMRLERLENHYNYLKQSNERIEANVNKISEALLGNPFGDIGLVERFKENSKRTAEMEKEIEKMKIYFKQFAWFTAIVVSAVLVILVKYIFKGL